MYRYELLLGQHHLSCFLLLDVLSKDRPVVSNDSLGAHLVMHVPGELFAGLLKHRLRPDLKSLLTFEIKLHADTMYQFIILRNFQSM
jgi:hypothetical protein